MAVFMIMDRSRTLPDTTASDRLCYKLGDIVQVFNDDKPLVIPPAEPFLFIKITGLVLTKAQRQRFADAYFITENDEERLERKRRFGFRVADIPTAIKNKLLKDRYIEVTKTQVQNYLRNKETGTDGIN
jgi:hypothetical protein